MSASPKPSIDWESVERDYRAGIKPLRLIGEHHGVSHTAIRDRAKKEEWKRDLSAKIKTREDELVSRAMVSKTISVESLVTEKRMVEGLAQSKATVRIGHQKKIARTMGVVEVMLGELELTSNPEGQGLIEALTDALRPEKGNETPEQQRKRQTSQRETLDRALGLAGRVDTGKKLVEMLERAVKLEREAYGIKSEDIDPNANAGSLNDAERASRTAAILATAMKRMADAQAQTPAKPVNAA